jgi:hypothetical protein
MKGSLEHNLLFQQPKHFTFQKVLDLSSKESEPKERTGFVSFPHALAK